MRKGFALSIVVFIYCFQLCRENCRNQGITQCRKSHQGWKPTPRQRDDQGSRHKRQEVRIQPWNCRGSVKHTVRIHLKALDREHGFEIKSIKDSCVKFKPDEPVTVEFYAGKAGEFEFTCCKFCGLGHKEMKGELIIK